MALKNYELLDKQKEFKSSRIKILSEAERFALIDAEMLEYKQSIIGLDSDVLEMIYGKPVEADEELENGLQDAEQFSEWNNDQAEQQNLYDEQN